MTNIFFISYYGIVIDAKLWQFVFDHNGLLQCNSLLHEKGSNLTTITTGRQGWKEEKFSFDSTMLLCSYCNIKLLGVLSVGIDILTHYKLSFPTVCLTILCCNSSIVPLSYQPLFGTRLLISICIEDCNFFLHIHNHELHHYEHS